MSHGRAMNQPTLPPTALRPTAGHRSNHSFAALRRSTITATAFYLMTLSWSPLLPALLGLPFSVSLLAAFVVLVVLTAFECGVNLRVALCCVLLMSASLLMSILGQSSLLLMRLAPLPLLLFVAWQTFAIRELPLRLCHLMSRFMLIGLAGALVGLVYSWFGGEAILFIANPDGRANGLYLTTMSNFDFRGVIRPSFIYDEAGAFSFMLCATVALREVLGLGRRTSLLLMLGGLVTFSLAHILITVLYLLFRIGTLKTMVLLAALLLPMVQLATQIDELEFLFDRFSIADGRLAGDNRSNQLENFFAVVHPGMVLFGDVECHARPERSCEHGDISSSPVTPTYRGGIVALFVQLVVHIALILAYLRDKRFRFSALALTLLLLQRPFLEFGGYGYITFLLLFLMLTRRAPRRRAGVAHVAASSSGAAAVLT